MVKSCLFCIQNFPCSVSFQCMLGVGVKVWTKNFQNLSFGGQTHFGMPRGDQMSLAPNEPIQNGFRANVHTDCMHWKLNKHGQVCLQNKQLPTKTPVELENRGAHIQDFMMWFQQLLFLHYNFAYGTLWWYTLEYNNIGASTYHALGWALWNFHRGHANDTIYRSTILASCHWRIGPIYSPEVAVLLRQQLHTKNRATHLRSFVINCQWIKWHPTLSPCYNIT